MYQVAFHTFAVLSTAAFALVLVQPATGDRFSGLCPSSYPRQVSINGTGRCYYVGSPGPCPKMMVVSASSLNPNFGQCRCKSLGNSCFGRPLLEWEDRCFFEFSQGPCRKGHWLVRNKQGQPTCQKNPCPLVENQRQLLRTTIPRKNYYFTLPHNQENGFQCFKTGTQAFCGEGERAYFLGSEPFPRCLNYEPWDCDHYSGQGGSFEHPSFSQQSVTLRQGDRKPAPGFGVPYDGI